MENDLELKDDCIDTALEALVDEIDIDVEETKIPEVDIAPILKFWNRGNTL